MKNLVILGSTGSIGRQALEAVQAAGEGRFRVLALCAGRDAAALMEQARLFKPRYIGLSDEAAAAEIRSEALAEGFCLLTGRTAAEELAALEGADTVVNAVSGFAGTLPLLSALRAGKTVALANKESIVCAHRLVWAALEKHGGRILPIDSEQSAIFQCLEGRDMGSVKRLLLTASGGPFRDWSLAAMQKVTPEMALRHPTWSMGKQITLDSATLFNKGLEVMEAAYLFKVEAVEVRIHPQSIVHSMVEFADGSVLAQMSSPDMRLAIAYALGYPERLPLGFGALELADCGPLTFERPDMERFPALRLAYAALQEGGALPVVYNAAKEAASALFFAGEIAFTDIASRVEAAMGRIGSAKADNIEDILAIDAWARRLAGKG